MYYRNNVYYDNMNICLQIQIIKEKKKKCNKAWMSTNEIVYF